MKKKVLNIVLVCMMALAMFFATNTQTQAAGWKNEYKKALETKISGGIYSEYAFINMKSFKKPVMLVIMPNWSSKQKETIPMAKLYYYENGKVKNIKNFELDSWVEVSDCKVKSKGKKYVITYKSGNSKCGMCTNYVIQSKNKIISVAKYVSATDTIAGRTYTVYTRYTGKHFDNFKEISKSTYNKATKISKKIKLKEHFAGKAKGYY